MTFPDIGFHQGSALNPFLFTIIIDELTKGIQDETSWYMLFADDIVLIDETRKGVNTKLERWRYTVETKGFKLRRLKTKYLHCRFSEGENGVTNEVVIRGAIIPRVERFKYLGSIIQENEKIDKDINQQIKIEWQKWKNASTVLCDKKILLRLKGRVYRMVLRLALLVWSGVLAHQKVSHRECRP